MKKSRLFFLTPIAALSGVAFVYRAGQTRARASAAWPRKVEETSLVAVSPMAVPVTQAGNVTPTAPPTPAALVSASRMPDEIKVLLALGPVGKWQAYELVKACAPACPELSPGQGTRSPTNGSTRRPPVHDAYAEFVAQGPDGAGLDVALAAAASSPAIQRHRDNMEKYHAIGVKTADPIALLDSALSAAQRR